MRWIEREKVVLIQDSIVVVPPYVVVNVLEELQSTLHHRLHPIENIQGMEMLQSTLEH